METFRTIPGIQWKYKTKYTHTVIGTNTPWQNTTPWKKISENKVSCSFRSFPQADWSSLTTWLCLFQAMSKRDIFLFDLHSTHRLTIIHMGTLYGNKGDSSLPSALMSYKKRRQYIVRNWSLWSLQFIRLFIYYRYGPASVSVCNIYYIG